MIFKQYPWRKIPGPVNIGDSGSKLPAPDNIIIPLQIRCYKILLLY